MLYPTRRSHWYYLAFAFFISCGTEEENNSISHVDFTVGVSMARGHEDITTLGAALANKHLGKAFFPLIDSDATSSKEDYNNPLIRGNYKTDFPGSTILSYYGVSSDSWHTNGSLQNIHSLSNHQGHGIESNKATCEGIKDLVAFLNCSDSTCIVLAVKNIEKLFWCN